MTKEWNKIGGWKKNTVLRGSGKKQCGAGKGRQRMEPKAENVESTIRYKTTKRASTGKHIEPRTKKQNLGAQNVSGGK